MKALLANQLSLVHLIRVDLSAILALETQETAAEPACEFGHFVSGIRWPPPFSLLLSSVLLPDREKHWNQPGAGVMIDDKPPLVRASLLTRCCTFQH